MRCLLLLAAAAMAVLAVGGQAAQPMSREKVLQSMDLFFRTASARSKFDEALKSVRGLGVSGLGPLMDRWRSQAAGGLGATAGVLRAPWESPQVMQHLNRVMDDGLGDLVERARRLIEAVAEPLKIEHIDLTQSNQMVQSQGNVTQVTIAQLSTFNILDSDVDLPTVSAKLAVDFDKLDAHGRYNVDATASGQLHVFGDGHFDIRLYRPTVEVFIKLGYDDEHFSVQELSIHAKMEKLKVVISNFLGGGEVGDLVCGIVSDVGPAALDLYQEEVNQIISSSVKETANALLNKLPINKIIDWIIYGGGSGGDDDNDDGDDDDDAEN